MHLFSRQRMLAVSVLACACISGCATVTRGRSQTWTVDSVPSGATVSLSNGERCETPCALKLRRKFPFSVELCKAGYHPIVTQILSNISGGGAAGMAGNVLLGGLVGAGVDVGTGATKDLRPNPLSVPLAAEDPGCVTPAFPSVPDGGQTPEDYQKAKGGAKSNVAKK